MTPLILLVIAQLFLIGSYYAIVTSRELNTYENQIIENQIIWVFLQCIWFIAFGYYLGTVM